MDWSIISRPLTNIVTIETLDSKVPEVVWSYVRAKTISRAISDTRCVVFRLAIRLVAMKSAMKNDEVIRKY